MVKGEKVSPRGLQRHIAFRLVCPVDKCMKFHDSFITLFYRAEPDDEKALPLAPTWLLLNPLQRHVEILFLRKLRQIDANQVGTVYQQLKQRIAYVQNKFIRRCTRL